MLSKKRAFGFSNQYSRRRDHQQNKEGITQSLSRHHKCKITFTVFEIHSDVKKTIRKFVDISACKKMLVEFINLGVKYGLNK